MISGNQYTIAWAVVIASLVVLWIIDAVTHARPSRK